MIKQVLIYFIVFISLYFICFYTHQYYLEKQEIVTSFSLKRMYLFHTGFSLIVCVNLLLLSTVNNMFDQLGFIYLATIVIKILFFSLIFYKSVYLAENLTKSTRISIVIPLLIFLLTEVVFVAKILNKK